MLYLVHHGIKGQKWGIRRFQYSDGSLTPAGRRRYLVGEKTSVRTVLKGAVKGIQKASQKKQYETRIIDKDTEFSRVQTGKKLKNRAFYAAHEEGDIKKYFGLYGRSLSNNMKDSGKEGQPFQILMNSTKRLRLPSDENAADVVGKLMDDKKFKMNLESSIQDARTRMRRPAQQLLFKEAENALKNDHKRMSDSEKVAVYKAFNLSLTYHNKEQNAAQKQFYNEMKKKGYDAILDYNDKDYSSYHAKHPVIIFDTNSVKLKSVTETDQKLATYMNVKYNAERAVKEIPAQTASLIKQYSQKSMSECTSYLERKIDDFLKH